MVRFLLPVRSLPFERLVDLAIAAPLFFFSLPVLVLLIALVRLDSPGHPIFTQRRVGRDGRLFTIYKLRSFYPHCHGIFPDREIRLGDPSVTRIGHFLRRSKLDELPQLVNVLRGDMGLVGPRPDIPEQARHYGTKELARLAVRPGLTGLAQISGNTWLSWPRRIELDLWYLQNRSWRVHLAILLHTIPAIFRGEAAESDPLEMHGR